MTPNSARVISWAHLAKFTLASKSNISNTVRRIILHKNIVCTNWLGSILITLRPSLRKASQTKSQIRAKFHLTRHQHQQQFICFPFFNATTTFNIQCVQSSTKLRARTLDS
ncbi:hypothetical protein DOY81_013454 [Sarcophaga bullata]|nr:hypothetical protein DOY81_013454 [Sarcophaga bullata]